MKKRLAEAYDVLQDMTIKATEGNLRRLLRALDLMQQVYQELDRLEKEQAERGAGNGEN